MRNKPHNLPGPAALPSFLKGGSESVAGAGVFIPMKRKSTGKRLRFEIFARDGFKCRYCGRQSDEVQLVLDHIEPVSKGGPTIPENLITACVICNQGKADKRLPDFLPTEQDRLIREQELREQERALRTARSSLKARKDAAIMVKRALKQFFGSDYVDKDTMHVLVSYLFAHGPELLFQWMEKASRKVRIYNAGKYISGIRRSWLKQQQEVAQ